MLSVQETLAALLECVATEYATEKAAGMRVLAQPGEDFTADWCGPDVGCSMAYVRLDTMGVSSTQFPDIDAAGTGRTGPLAVTWHIGVARCVAGMSDSGDPPAAELQTADAERFVDDARRLRAAIVCCLSANTRELSAKTTLLGGWTPRGPLGNCASGHWPLTTRAR